MKKQFIALGFIVLALAACAAIYYNRKADGQNVKIQKQCCSKVGFSGSYTNCNSGC